MNTKINRLNSALKKAVLHDRMVQFDDVQELDDLFDAVSSGAFEAMGSIEETRDAWLVDRD